MVRDSRDAQCQWLLLMMALALEEPVNLAQATKSRCACYPLEPRAGGQTWTMSAGGNAGAVLPPPHMLPQTKDPCHGTCLVLVGGVSLPRAVSSHLQE